MHEDVRVVGFRRVQDRRGILRLIHGRRVYEVCMSDGTRRRVSFGTLDKLVDAGRYPADFWACVHAADSERDRLGDREEPRMTLWPNGTPQKWK